MAEESSSIILEHHITLPSSAQNTETGDQDTMPLETYAYQREVGLNGNIGTISLEPIQMHGGYKYITALGLSFIPHDTDYKFSIGIAPAPVKATIRDDLKYDIQNMDDVDFEEKYKETKDSIKENLTAEIALQQALTSKELSTGERRATYPQGVETYPIAVFEIDLQERDIAFPIILAKNVDEEGYQEIY